MRAAISLILILVVCSDASAIGRLRARLHARRGELHAQRHLDSGPQAGAMAGSFVPPFEPPAPAEPAPERQDGVPRPPREPSLSPEPPKIVRRSAGLAMDQVEARMVSAINQYRAGYGLPPLEPDPVLMKVAHDRVSVYDHHHPRYGWSWEHCRRCGFPGPASDNLAQGHLTPEEAVGINGGGWASSDGHARQMRGYTNINRRWVDQRFNCCGVANRGRNWIAVFGRR